MCLGCRYVTVVGTWVWLRHGVINITREPADHWFLFVCSQIGLEPLQGAQEVTGFAPALGIFSLGLECNTVTYF